MTHDSNAAERSSGKRGFRNILLGGGPRERTALIWLTALLLLQIGLLLWVYWPRTGSASQPVPILGELNIDQVVGLTITDEAGDKIRFSKREDKWWLQLSPGGEEEPAAPLQCSEDESSSCYPAVNQRVETFLDALADLDTSRLVATSESSRARLRVAEDRFVRRVEIEQADGERNTLYLGTSPSFGATHVRSSNQAAIYLADGLSGADAATATNNWIDTVYFQAEEAEIQSLEIANASGTLNFAQDETGQWQMDGLKDGEAFNAGQLLAMLPSVTSLHMVEPLGAAELPAYGMDQPNAVLTLVIESDGETSLTRTLTIGAKDEEDINYVVKSSESPFYVLASGFSMARVVESAREDFLAADEPEPTQKAEGDNQ